MTSDIDTRLKNIGLTRDIVSSFVGHNSLQPADLPALIAGIHGMLSQLSTPQAAAPVERRTPAVSVRKSITDEYLVCLEDGKQFKSLKRHLRSKYNLTPEEYRARWNLPPDYPMVAPGYAAERSQLAKAMGLGKDKRAAAAE